MDMEKYMEKFDAFYWNEIHLHELVQEFRTQAENIFDYEGTTEYLKGRLSCVLEVITTLMMASPTEITPTYFDEMIPHVTVTNDYTEGYIDQREVLYMDFRTKFGY